jgi:hypothetical protein
MNRIAAAHLWYSVCFKGEKRSSERELLKALSLDVFKAYLDFFVNECMECAFIDGQELRGKRFM